MQGLWTIDEGCFSRIMIYRCSRIINAAAKILSLWLHHGDNNSLFRDLQRLAFKKTTFWYLSTPPQSSDRSSPSETHLTQLRLCTNKKIRSLLKIAIKIKYRVFFLFPFRQTLANRLYGVMAWSIPILVSCSTFGSANGSAFSGGRYGKVDIISCLFIGVFSLILEERLFDALNFLWNRV